MSILKHKVIDALGSHQREVTVGDSDGDNPMRRYNGSREQAAYPQAMLATQRRMRRIEVAKKPLDRQYKSDKC